MSYPFDEERDVESTVELDLEMLREDLIFELQGINQYQTHIESLEDEPAIKVLTSIVHDKKRHVVDLFSLIQNLDEVQAEKFKKRS